MRAFTSSHARSIKRIATAALCLALGMTSLVACSGQQSASSSAADEASSPASSQVSSLASSQASPAAPSQASATDPSSWKTLGDALATQTASMASGYDENYYVCVFQSGDSYYRVVAKMEPDIDEKIKNVDWSKDNVSEQIEEAASPLPLVSADDITSDAMQRDELDQLVGKTGKELVESGYTFTAYSMYGGEQTIANFDKGYFNYELTFDVSVDEKQTEDEGAAVMDAVVVQADLLTTANSATDPTKVS